MHNILLIKSSPFQIYSANYLFEKNIIESVIVEDGVSFHVKRNIFKSILSTIKGVYRTFPFIIKKPVSTFEYIKLLFNKNKYYGNVDYHHQRILRKNYDNFHDGLKVNFVSSINSDKNIQLLRAYAPNNILVFGTSLLSNKILNSTPGTFINMHWGWSPDYRGEGIVSALAKEGVSGLGVTIHCLSDKIDGGDIVSQKRLETIDVEDNFYSIGLKLAVLGTYIFERTIFNMRNNIALNLTPQDISQGFLYHSKYMKAHPELYGAAWKNLHNY